MSAAKGENVKTRLVLAIASVTLLAMGLGPVASAGDTTFHGPLTAISGSGSGRVQGATTGEDQGTLVVQGTANVHRTTPNTTFTVQRSLDTVPDGVCDTSGGFVELTTFTTSSGGAGAGHFERHAPLPSGQAFDVLFQAVGTDGTVLESPCFTVTVK